MVIINRQNNHFRTRIECLEPAQSGWGSMAKNPLESSNEIENPIPSSANPLPQSITTNKPARADQYNHFTIIDIPPSFAPANDPARNGS